MSTKLTPTQTLILWSLIAKKGEAWRKDIKPEPSSPDRLALERARLISSERRGSKGFWLSVTDAGWAWASDHLDSELPLKTQSAGPILQAWLTHLHAFLKQRNIALAEFMSDRGARTGDATEDDVRRAYLTASGGAWNKRVHLFELRRILAFVPRPRLDDMLLSMQRQSKLILFGLDNQREISAEDREAAIHIAGEPRHVLRMGG